MRKANFPDMNELKRAFRDTPAEFTEGVEDTLRSLRQMEEPKKMKRKIPMALVFAVIALLLMTGTAYAVSQSKTLDWFRFIYGSSFLDGNELKNEELNITYELGDVIYSLDDVLLGDGVIYASGTIRAKEGSNIVLIPEDCEISEPAGYMVHFSLDEAIPNDAPSFLDLAVQRDARIILATVSPRGYYKGEEYYESEAGMWSVSQPDNTIAFGFELYVSASDGTMVTVPVEGEEQNKDAYYEKFDPAQTTFTIDLGVSNWEIDRDGNWLREEPNDTWLRADWVVTAVPTEYKGIE